MNVLTHLEQQIRRTRDYTNGLLAATDPARWFDMPADCRSHIAWQVGHLAMGQFRLGIHYVRDVMPADEAILSPTFMALFRKGTVATTDASSYPAVEEIRSVYDRMHQHLLAQLPAYANLDLDAPACHAHKMFDTKFGALTWLTHHEMIHAGQIGLLRRMLGDEPIGEPPASAK